MIELAFYLVLYFTNGQIQLLGPYASEVRCHEVQVAAVKQITAILGSFCMEVEHDPL